MESRETLLRRIDRLSRRARAYLVWERFAPVLAIGAAALILFVIGSVSGLWQRIGDPWRLIALIITLVFIARSLWAARAVQVPTASQARRRVESDSALEHRPLETVRDSLAGTPNSDTSLWDEHTRRAATAAASASAPRLKPALAARDPYYLRYVLPACLGLSLMLGLGDSFERLRASLSPSWQSAVSGSDARYEAWIDPPDYTGRPPVYFKSKSRIEAPAGSELVTRVSGVKDAPRLYVQEGGKGRRISVTRLGPKSFEARTTLGDSAKARWRIGTTPKEWRVDIVPDTAPQIEFTEEPKASKRDKLEFKYSLLDDFGSQSLELEMRLMDEDRPSELISAEESIERFTVPLPGQSVRKAEDVLATLDLTKHRWAGKRVTGRLIATDYLKQVGMSEPVVFIVPDRIFISPLAKAIIENRNLLLSVDGESYEAAEVSGDSAANIDMIDPISGQPITLVQDAPDARIITAPAPVQRSALLLDAITDRPVSGFRDPVVFMGLKNVQSRLNHARSMDEISDAPEDLWLIAMRAEFGPLGNAKEAMIAAEAALRDGIARRARQREIDTLFQRYNEAVDRYMEFLMESATIAEGGEGGGGGGRNTDEIQALLDAIEEANRMGDTEGARRALAQLAELLENMRIQLTQGGEGEGGEPLDSDGLSDEVKEALEDIADALGEQRQLQDQTQEAQREQQEQGGPQGGGQQGQSQPGNKNGDPSGGEQVQSGGAEQGGSDQGGSEQGRSEQAGNESGDAPSGQQLAENQAALQDAIDALEESLRASGTDMDAIPEARGGGEEGGANAAGQGDDLNIDGGGGEFDPDAPPGRGGTGGDDPEGDALRAQIDTNGDGGISPDEALEAARRAMELSEDSLSVEDFAGANEAQQQAIEALRAAASSLIAQSDLSEQDGEGGTRAGGREGDRGDPFGREADGEGTATGLGADVPEKSDRQRARELIEELRRRAAEQNRDAEELDYLDRLLERF